MPRTFWQYINDPPRRAAAPNAGVEKNPCRWKPPGEILILEISLINKADRISTRFFEMSFE